jgi:transcriptional regulator NrdR family protein
MKCEKCGGKSKVIGSTEGDHWPGVALTPDEINVCRRRKCLHCGHRWNTVELRAKTVIDHDCRLKIDSLKGKISAARRLISELERLTR